MFSIVHAVDDDARSENDASYPRYFFKYVVTREIPFFAHSPVERGVVVSACDSQQQVGGTKGGFFGENIFAKVRVRIWWKTPLSQRKTKNTTGE